MGRPMINSVVAQYSAINSPDNPGIGRRPKCRSGGRRSEAIVFLDADDWLLPEAIEEGLACFERNPQSGLVYGGHRRTDANWRRSEGTVKRR
jgi:GT2 family glycosyltransferase